MHSMGANLQQRMSDTSADRLRGKRLLVTGAGGSIGSALAQALLTCEAASLVFLERSEFALYELQRSLTKKPLSQALSFVLGSSGDEQLLSSLFSTHSPEIVFHTAAYKQVPLLENNPFAAIAENVLGTHTLIQAAVAHRVEDFVQVSTDKAVHPHSIMGASKRIAELLLLGAVGGGTRMSAVRLGNVYASQGSVVSLFLDQIARGGPLTVTHPEASRFFMSMDQAISAIIATLEPRPAGIILVPELASPLLIIDLAKRLIAEHDSAASIQFTGLRPGDKLTESLVSRGETFLPAPREGSGSLRAVDSPAPAKTIIVDALHSLKRAVASSDIAALLESVQALVPEYTPSSVISKLMQDAQEGRSV